MICPKCNGNVVIMERRIDGNAHCVNCKYTWKPMFIKPPIGIIPKPLWQEKRIADLKKCIGEYVNANLHIPIEWLQEYNEHIKSVKEL